LKAQAVAARTYIHKRSGIHAHQGYDLCDTAHCQAYGGMNDEAISTDIAVDATRDVLALYEGQPIEAQYFSSSGGATENSESVWQTPLPYLRSVPDTYETDAREWSRTLTAAQMNDLLAASGYSIGGFTGLSVAELTAAGRVNRLVINGTAGSVNLTKEEVRTFFSRLPGGSLESRTFSVSYGPFAGSGGGGVNITGRGYGHGVGMSQYGAKGMAEAGFTFDQILQYYYTGITVDRLAR
jgi:stage II sporulation protein D